MALSIIILTGQSGSGKSTAVRALEDQGFLCVDNMPPGLAEPMISTLRDADDIDRLALVIDVREPGRLRDAPELISRLRDAGDPLRVVFLETREETLLRRYSETRRRHPLDEGSGLRNSIVAEREILAPLRELADDTIDTSGLSPHELRAKFSRQIVGAAPGHDLSLALLSFGFKYGLPLDADMVLDVRFLPNPYFVSELRELTGLHQSVSSHVLDSDIGRSYIDHLSSFLAYLLPHFQAEGKRYLTVAMGCTGGRHRSVSVAIEIARRFKDEGIAIDLRHRDIHEDEEPR